MFRNLYANPMVLSLHLVLYKYSKAFATDLKTIYQALDEEKVLLALENVIEKVDIQIF